MVHNQEGVILYRNEMLQRMCGGDAHALAHEALRALFPIDVIGAMERAFLRHESGIVEQEFCLLDSELKHLVVRSAVVEVGKGEVARIWSFRDVTKLRRLEADMHGEAELLSVTKFAGELSHYMRALLSHIGELAVQLGTIQDINVLAAQHISSISRSVQEGVSFADRVASLTAGDRYRPAEGESEDLYEALRVVAEATQLSVGERIAIKLEAEPSLPRVPLTMRSLSSILGNVVSNAVEAIEGQGWIRIAAHAEPGQHAVRVRVEDSGNGMDPATTERVCEPFFTTKAPGAVAAEMRPLKGLGMWNVHALVRAMGGSLTLSSKPEAGTSVVLDIPSM